MEEDVDGGLGLERGECFEGYKEKENLKMRREKHPQALYRV